MDLIGSDAVFFWTDFVQTNVEGGIPEHFLGLNSQNRDPRVVGFYKTVSYKTILSAALIACRQMWKEEFLSIP